jgi:hypothetical protein
MTGYVAAAFAVTAVIFAWDYLAPRWKLSRVRRAIRMRQRRDAARKKP